MASQLQTFDQALSEYRKVRNAADALESPIEDAQNDKVTERIDEALDRFLGTESPSFMALRTKLRVLEREYGRDWQGRHIKALLVDAAVPENRLTGWKEC